MLLTDRLKHLMLCCCTILFIISLMYIISFSTITETYQISQIKYNNNTVIKYINNTVIRRESESSLSILSLIKWSINPKQFCFGNFSSEVVIVSLGDITDSITSDLTELSRLNKGYYSMKYGYAYCEFAANTEISRNPVYSKAPILLNALKLYKYAIWIDFDIIAHDKSRSFDKLIKIFKQNDSVHGIVPTDINIKPWQIVDADKNWQKKHETKEDTIKQPPESVPPYYFGVNTGIVLFRSCNWTFNFIKEWHSYFNKAEDQQSIFWHSYEHSLEWYQHIQIINYYDIELMGDKLKKKKEDDDHLWHLAGGKWTWNQKQHDMRDLILKHMNKTILQKYHKYKSSL